MGATQESNVVGSRSAAPGEWLSMIVLDPGARRAAAAPVVGPRALDAVTFSDLPANCPADVAVLWQHLLRGTRALGAARASSATWAALSKTAL
jgi:hypothetical protein